MAAAAHSLRTRRGSSRQPFQAWPHWSAGGLSSLTQRRGAGGAPSQSWQVPARRLLLRLIPAFLLLGPACASPGSKKASFGLRARIVSGWPRTPPAAQSLEWLRDVDAEQASAFLRGLGAGGLGGGDDSAGGLKHVEDRLRSASARTFHELLVRNAYYSPRIETLRSLERSDRRAYGGACAAGAAWALLWPVGAGSPVAACDAEALRAELVGRSREVPPSVAGQEPGELPAGYVDSELALVLQRGGDAGVVVVYGALSAEGLSSLAPLLAAVEAVGSKAAGWRIVFRHADGRFDAGGPGADDLTGYGFELAIKSSEYKTHADEKKDKEGEEATSEEAESAGEAETPHQEDAGGELDGLVFNVLTKRYSSLRRHLRTLKEELEVEKDTDAVLKAWEIKDIGLQATARIKSSETPLLQLMRLSQNFPAHVVGLARSSVPDAIRKGATKLRQVVRENGEVFSVNGRLVRPDHSDLSLFPMMKTLQPFFVGVERLVRAGVTEKVACELLKESHGMRLPERLDWRSPYLSPPSYVVTKDKKSQRWGGSLQHLMYAFPGGLAPVRLPLYTVVFVFDPADLSDLQQAQQFLAQTPLPMALHFVMLPGGAGQRPRSTWDEQALGNAPTWLQQAQPSASAGLTEGNKASQAIAAGYGHLLTGGEAGTHASGAPKRARAFLKALVEWAAQNLATETESGQPQRWPSTEEGMAAIKGIWKANLAPEESEDIDALWERLVDPTAHTDSSVANSTRYVSSLGVPVPCVLVNGKLLLKGAYDGQQSIYPTIVMEQQTFQRAVYMGQLSHESKIADFVASLGLLSAYHEDITPEVAQRGGEEGMPGQTVEISYLQWPSEAFLGLPFLKSAEQVAEGDGANGVLNFFHVTVLRDLSQAYLLHTFAAHLLSPDRSAVLANQRLKVPPFASHWTVVIEADSAAGSALAELKACVDGTLLLEAADADAAASLNRQQLSLLKFLGLAVPAALAADPALPSGRIRELCDLAISKKIDPELHEKAKALSTSSGGAAVSQRQAALLDTAAAELARAGSRQAALWVCNGRRVLLEAGGQLVSPRHIQALELMEAQYDVGEVGTEDGAAAEDEEAAGAQDPRGGRKKAPVPVKALHEWLGEALPEKVHGLAAAIRSEALSHGRNERFTQPVELFDVAPPAMRLQLPPALPDAASPIKVYGILDPLSPTAQSASAVLALFGMAFNAEVNLVLNPQLRHSEYPLKRYYREVIRWPERLADGRSVSELEEGRGLVEGSAELTLATKHVLTAAVHVLPTWLVTAHEAEHDMDNLRLVDVGDGKWCETTYLLRQLYVEGQAFILGDDGWPVASAKGLQIEVVSKGGQEAPPDDTIVMGNLGYFQVHGNPGLYEVSLKAGLSNETFEPANKKDVEVSSYITPPYQLRVKLRPGHRHEDLFEEGQRGLGGQRGTLGGGQGVFSRLFGRLESMLGGESGKPEPATRKDVVPSAGGEGKDTLPTIHIFSVASGHLYEKLLSIMILSVRNRTKCPLHFWFIDNFLSPKFKDFIPAFAERYNFGFDFVTYKWPSWLNPQSEKQRLIWAYKVLFLDVLFPLDVPKVLFIDADQVVRADVRELWDMDLRGKVYGFVPMGDTNPATEGFRFWKQGYWKNHLGGLPYHISALYVVDLAEFRRMSVGDQLRGIYNQLSRDPNSLSNLEQDLVNFAQHQVPIHSLPAEWLWCETWCSQETKPQAKTIDLCQNPLTKEPKIIMAKRVIQEWQGYHDEVQRFQEERERQHRGPGTPGVGGQEAAAEARGGKVEL